MKNRNIITIAAILIMLGISSCEDFLDKPIEGQVPLAGVDYTDESRMYEPVAAIYGRANNNNVGTWSDNLVFHFRSDFIIKGAHANDQPVFEEVDNYNMEAMRNAWFVNGTWTRHYGLIRDVNASLEELDKFGEHATNQNLVKQYKAEVRWWRALEYFRLTRVYGEIPWYDKDILSGNLRNSPRLEVYDWLKAELQDIIPDLPAQHPNQLARKGGITKWAAYMMLAKVAADVQDYDLMLSASKAIYDSGLFSLYPDFYNLFKKSGNLCDENIMELQHTDFGQASGDRTNLDQFYASSGIKQQGGTKWDGTNFSSGWGFLIPTVKYIEFLQDRGEGIRWTTSIIYPNTKTAEGDSIGRIPSDLQALLDRYNANGPVAAEAYLFKSYYPFKDQTPGRHRYGGWNNIVLYRYADALLLYAEALVHKNGAGSGDAPINLVRARAGMAPLSGATVDDILDERAAELEFEWGSDRFWDLVRLDRTSELGPKYTKGEDEFFPVPTTQIDLQPGLALPAESGLFPTVSGK